jgi:hypothetical protein
MVVGFASYMTKADVTGSFKAKIILEPIDCSAFGISDLAPSPGHITKCEDTIQKSDVETDLNVNWTVSGLTLGFDVVAGFTGLEHILTSLKATLGALNITDNFFFATPFGTDEICFINPINRDTVCELSFTEISHNLLFVKKRVDASISLAGITIDNLAEFGDVTFPQDQTFGPSGLPCAELFTDGRCPFLPLEVNFPNGYTAADQHFAFGDALTISGQTVSGITVTNITGICMDPQLFEGFKKISFAGRINPECAALPEVSAQGDEVDTVIKGNSSLTEVVAMPSPINVLPDGTAQLSVSLVNDTCSGATPNLCHKILSITNTGALPVTFHFSVVASQFSVGGDLKVGCEASSATPWTSGSDSITLPANAGGSSITNCGWTATYNNGVTAHTSIQATTDLPGDKTPLFFDVEKIQLEGIPIGPITANEFLEFRPLRGFSAVTDLTFNTPLGAVEALLHSSNITNQFFDGASVTLSSGGVTILQIFTATLAPLLTRVTLATTLNPDSNPASLKIAFTICQAKGSDDTFTGFNCTKTGLRRLDLTLSVKRSGVSLSTFARLSGGPPIALSTLRFTLSAAAGAVNLGASIQILPSWLGVFNVGVNF